MLWTDVVIIIGFVLYFSTGFLTNFSLAEVSLYTEAAQLLESNPIARKALDYRYGLFMLQVTVTAMLGGIYWLLRRRYTSTHHVANQQIFEFYTIAMFLIFLQNFMNDLPIFLKLVVG